MRQELRWHRDGYGHGQRPGPCRHRPCLQLQAPGASGGAAGCPADCCRPLGESCCGLRWCCFCACSCQELPASAAAAACTRDDLKPASFVWPWVWVVFCRHVLLFGCRSLAARRRRPSWTACLPTMAICRRYAFSTMPHCMPQLPTSPAIAPNTLIGFVSSALGSWFACLAHGCWHLRHVSGRAAQPVVLMMGLFCCRSASSTSTRCR